MMKRIEWYSVLPKLTAFKDCVELPLIINYPLLLIKTDKLEFFVPKDVIELFIDKFDTLEANINLMKYNYFSTLESSVNSKILDLKSFYIQLPRDVPIVFLISSSNLSKILIA